MRTEYAISTHWNAFRHRSGEEMIEEIVRDLDLHHVELGYDLRVDLVPGVKRMVAEGAVQVNSLHNFCPVPIGAPQGHPELFVMGSLNRRVRQAALMHTTKTIRFAEELGAKVVVCHAGNVEMRRLTGKLIALCVDGKQFSPPYERIKEKLLVRREKKARAYLDHLCTSIEALLPVLDASGIALAFENLPTWESIPTETEMNTIARRFDSPRLRYWHDFGHGQIRHNLGLSAHFQCLEKLVPWLAGFHIHDTNPPAHDHLMPPEGSIDFNAFSPLIPDQALKVFEPAPGMPAEVVRQGINAIRNAWETPATASP
jgi:sugar phosphate isomerase/epimerase